VTASTALQLLLGLAILTAGGEALVRGASRLALAAGVSPLVIGLTVVAFGTSSPELVVSLLASSRGQPDIAVANVVGSNVFNVLFILGVCALIVPLVIARQIWLREVPILIAVSLFLVVISLDGTVSQPEAAILVLGLAAYVVSSVRASRRESADAQREAAHGEMLDRPMRGGLGVSVALVAGGLGALVLGARWFVDGAVAVARAAGLSEVVIGLTIVAVGTSLPEVVTSVIATIRGERDIAIGNVIGSNIWNVLGIVGIAGLLAPNGLVVHESLRAFDMPFMAAVAVACAPLFFTGRTLARWEGGLFLGYYFAYAAYLVLAATEHDSLHAFSAAMASFVVPLTGITIAVVVVRSLHLEHRTRREVSRRD
jgi:cation:H+ antiporter